MGWRMKNFNIFGVHGKIQVLRGEGGSQKTNIQGLPKYIGIDGKGGLGQFAKEAGWCFWEEGGWGGGGEGWYPDAHYARLMGFHVGYLILSRHFSVIYGFEWS